MSLIRENGPFTLYESDITVVSGVVVVAGLDVTKSHCFVGVQFFDDLEGTIPSVPTSGSVSFTIKTINSSPIFEPILGGFLDLLTGTETTTWSANTEAVKATPASIVGSTHYKVVVTCNNSGGGSR